MEFMINIDIPEAKEKINYKDPILLTGSCFTEHIGDRLEELKFQVIQNPHGILFDPLSVANSLVSYTTEHIYTKDELFYLNEVWNSWQHHSRFSTPDQETALKLINASRQRAHDFLKKAEWLIVTLGTAFSYRLTDVAPSEFHKGLQKLSAVANNHRAPAQWFRKHLMPIEEINSVMDNALHQLFQFNPRLKIIFTVSPVRHIRDGVVDNNRSKARLLEVTHNLVNKFDQLYYFPAYELVIDVLRDYRFYDIDLVHPNYPATEFVLEKFMEAFLDKSSRQLAEEIKQIVTARKHKPFQPSTEAHKKFLQSYSAKTKELAGKYPFLSLEDELDYFSRSFQSL
jgi:hypothetical protein